MTERILPAYPLWLVDPLFSVWSKTDTLNAGDTVFWTGLEKRAFGFVRWNGKTYSFLGRRDRVIPLTQTSLEVHAFSTDYTFRGEGFTLKVRFLSPLLPNDLEVLSCPVCYTDYEVTEGEIPKDFSIALAIDEEFCYNGERSWVVGGVIPMKGFEAAYFTRGRNLVLSDTSDMCSPDWGDIYLAAKESWLLSEAGLTLYLSEGKREYLRKDCERLYLLAVNTEKKGTFLTAFDDKVSVFYFGEWLKCYFFRNGKNILDALEFSFSEHARIVSECEAFDEQLKSDCEKVGSGYYTIACASLRQSVAAHKLVETKDGKLLFLSKENNSNGCIGTADVSYPSIPLYLLYNPELVQGMLRGIYDFAKMPVWNFDFAPHDLGTYPWCSGQIYGTAQRDDKYCCGMYSTWASPRTNQMLYLRPAESEVYEKNMQMPVEECGNMIIMQAAAIAAGADKSLAEENFSLLAGWVKYLEEFGLSPENQLCTDDFAGHLAGNVNLTVKALVGIEAFSLICRFLGKEELSEEYERRACSFAEAFREKAGTGILPLAYGERGTFSIKYNILFDKLFGFSLIGQDICEAETSYYIEKANRYGVPLDTREDYTKADWILWAAALTDEKEKCEKLYAPVLAYLKGTPSRVPFGDWYYSTRGDIVHFINRSVVGGCFAPLLKVSGKCNVKR